MINRHFGAGISYGDETKAEILAYIAWGYSKKEAARLADIGVRAIDGWLLKDPAFRTAYDAARIEGTLPLPEIDKAAKKIWGLCHDTRRAVRQAQKLGLWVQINHGHDSSSVEIWKSPEACTTAIDKDRSIRLLRDVEIS